MDYTNDHPLRDKMIGRMLGKAQMLPTDDLVPTRSQLDILKCHDYRTIIKPLVIMDSFEGKLSVRQLAIKYQVHFMVIQRILAGSVTPTDTATD